MFELKFTPDFARQRSALIAQDSIPMLPLPQSIEDSLAGFSNLNPVAALSSKTLWLESIRAVRPMVFKAALI